MLKFNNCIKFFSRIEKRIQHHIDVLATKMITTNGMKYGKHIFGLLYFAANNVDYNLVQFGKMSQQHNNWITKEKKYVCMYYLWSRFVVIESVYYFNNKWPLSEVIVEKNIIMHFPVISSKYIEKLMAPCLDRVIVEYGSYCCNDRKSTLSFYK